MAGNSASGSGFNTGQPHLRGIVNSIRSGSESGSLFNGEVGEHSKASHKDEIMAIQGSICH